MKYIPIPVLVLFVFTATAQPTKRIDSLKAIVARKNDPGTYLEIYKAIAPVNRDSAFQFLEKARAYTSDKKLETEIGRFFARDFLRRGFYSMAQKEYFEALKLAMELNDSAQIAGVYLGLGSVAYHSHLYEKAAQFSEEGLKFAGKNEAIKAAIKNNYGMVLYSNNRDTYKAISIYQELLPNANAVTKGMFQNNLGTAFLKLNNYDSAYKHIKATLDYTLATGDSAKLMYNYRLMGQYYFQTGQFNGAKSCFKRALALDKKFGDNALWTTVEVPELYHAMVEIYTKENKPDSTLWIKNFYISFLQEKLENQRKNSSEFIFGNQQSELNRLVLQQNQSRKNLAEYYAIALVILFSVVAYFVLSGKDKQRKYAPYISIVILVLAFEFILVVLDPFISKFTNDEPLYDFLCNALVAFLIVPIQFWGERILKRFALDIKIRKVAEEA